MPNLTNINHDAPSSFDQTSEEGVYANEREEIAVLSTWCTAPRGSGCTRCINVCPHHALTMQETGPILDSSLCSRCGLCAGVCDAFAWKRITLEDLVLRSEREAKSEGSVVFTCNEHIFPGLAPRSNVIILPCLASLPPEFWSNLLAKKIPVSLFLDRSYCEQCTIAGPLAPTLFDYAFQQAQDWTGRTIHQSKLIPERESVLSLYANIDEGSRRDLLSVLANESIDIATGKHRKRNTGAIDSFHEKQERLRAEGRIKSAQQSKNLPAAFQQKTTWPRQELVVEAVRNLPERANLLERYASTTTLTICQQSHECVNACPTGARRINEEGYPEIDITQCIACGICCNVCPHHACNLAAISAQEYCERVSHEQES